jgi:RimJ/RimL family protein N-acetyltransferase
MAFLLFSGITNNIKGGETMDKIIAYTDPENTASARVLEKSGFNRGEVNEKAYEAPDMVTKEVRWYPAVIWSLERPKSI